MNTDEENGVRELIVLAARVSAMLRSVLAVVGDSSDTAFAVQQITVGVDRRELFIFLAAAEAARVFEQAAAKAFDVVDLNVKGKGHE